MQRLIELLLHQQRAKFEELGAVDWWWRCPSVTSTATMHKKSLAIDIVLNPPAFWRWTIDVLALFFPPALSGRWLVRVNKWALGYLLDTIRIRSCGENKPCWHSIRIRIINPRHFVLMGEKLSMGCKKNLERCATRGFGYGLYHTNDTPIQSSLRDGRMDTHMYKMTIRSSPV